MCFSIINVTASKQMGSIQKFAVIIQRIVVDDSGVITDLSNHVQMLVRSQNEYSYMDWVVAEGLINDDRSNLNPIDIITHKEGVKNLYFYVLEYALTMN